jgi:hypothetical protein
MLLPMLAVAVVAQDIYRNEKLPIPVNTVKLLITTSDLGPIAVPTPIPVPTSREPRDSYRYGPKPGLKEMK